MSFDALLVHRCNLMRLAESNQDGIASYTWSTIKRSIPLRIDLSFQRRGKDPDWISEAGRPTDRTGVAFFGPGLDVRPGDRIVMTHGPTGRFELQGSRDYVPDRYGDVHHIEIGVQEVAQAIAPALPVIAPPAVAPPPPPPDEWDPSLLGSIMVLLDAADVTTSPVPSWTDEVNGFEFAPFTSPDRAPTWGATNLGDQPGVQFRWQTSAIVYDGQGLECVDPTLCALFGQSSNPWTAHIVARFEALSADANVNQFYVPFVAEADDATRSAGYVAYSFAGPASVDNYMFVGADAGSPNFAGFWNLQAIPDAFGDGDIHVLTVSWTGTALTVYFDGIELVPDTDDYETSVADFPCTRVVLGDDYTDNFPPLFSDSPMATYGAVYIQSEAVSAEDLGSLVLYAQNRWQ